MQVGCCQSKGYSVVLDASAHIVARSTSSGELDSDFLVQGDEHDVFKKSKQTPDFDVGG